MADVLSKVKSALGITGNYQDDTLIPYIEEVQRFMVDAGVSEPVASSEMSAGLIARGVTDLWNYGSAAGNLSEYFYQRLSQMCYALKCGKIIDFAHGDYGASWVIVIDDNVLVDPRDEIIFTCGEVVKTYTNLTCNAFLLDFTKEESEKLEKGSYKWDLKLKRDNALITVMNDGWIIVW